MLGQPAVPVPDAVFECIDALKCKHAVDASTEFQRRATAPITSPPAKLLIHTLAFAKNPDGRQGDRAGALALARKHAVRVETATACSERKATIQQQAVFIAARAISQLGFNTCERSVSTQSDAMNPYDRRAHFSGERERLRLKTNKGNRCHADDVSGRGKPQTVVGQLALDIDPRFTPKQKRPPFRVA